MKQNMPQKGLHYVDFVTLIVQSYFDTLLCYVCSVTFCGAAVLKVQGTVFDSSVLTE